MTMICFSLPLLRSIGADADLLEICAPKCSGNRLAFTSIFSFGGDGGGGHDRAVLLAEFHRPPRNPRRALLVGVSDRYGEAAKLEADVLEVCCDEFVHRRPTPSEARIVMHELQSVYGAAAAGIRRLFEPLRGNASATTQSGRRVTAVVTPEIAQTIGVDTSTPNVVIARDWRWSSGDIAAHRPNGARWDVVLIGYGPYDCILGGMPSGAEPRSIAGVDAWDDNLSILHDAPGARQIWEHCVTLRKQRPISPA